MVHRRLRLVRRRAAHRLRLVDARRVTRDALVLDDHRPRSEYDARLGLCRDPGAGDGRFRGGVAAQIGHYTEAVGRAKFSGLKQPYHLWVPSLQHSQI